MKRLKLISLIFLSLSLVLFLAGCSIFNQPPSASFTAHYSSNETAPLDAVFDASDSYDSDGFIASYQWRAEGSNIGRGETINHTFQSSGDHSLSLTVTDDKGATDTTYKTISVQADEQLNISVYEVYGDPGALEAYDLYLQVEVEGTTKRIPGSSSQPDWWSDVSGWRAVSGSETFDISEDKTYFDIEVDIFDADTASADDYLTTYTFSYNKNTEEVVQESSDSSKADFKADYLTTSN